MLKLMEMLTFHGIQPAALLFSYKIHFSNIALSNKLDLVEARRSDFYSSHLNAVTTVCSAECNAFANLARTRYAVDARNGDQIARHSFDHGERTAVAMNAKSVHLGLFKVRGRWPAFLTSITLLLVLATE